MDVRGGERDQQDDWLGRERKLCGCVCLNGAWWSGRVTTNRTRLGIRPGKMGRMGRVSGGSRVCLGQVARGEDARDDPG